MVFSRAWLRSFLAVLGSLMIAFALGLHLRVRLTRWGAAGPMLLVLSGIGPAWAGLVVAVPAHFLMTFLGARVP